MAKKEKLRGQKLASTKYTFLAMLDAGTKFSFLTISPLIRSDPAWLDHDPGARERSTQVDVHPLTFRQRGIYANLRSAAAMCTCQMIPPLSLGTPLEE